MTHGGQRRIAVWHVFHRLRGTYLDVNGALGPNPAGAQCVNVCNAVFDALGVPGVFGNASDWIGFHDEHRGWIDGPSIERLTVGDVAVFRPEIVGPNGHADVVLDGSRTPYAGMDQNWPLGSPVSEVWHHREALAGVLRVKG